MGAACVLRMMVVRVAVALTLASSATTGLDPDLGTQDISAHRPLILAHVVSGSEGGLADGIYWCADPVVAHSVATCAHVREPLLRLERHETRRMIFSGANPVYQAEGDILTIREEEEEWVWLHAANKPPRDAPSLTVLTVRDTGCFDDARDNNSSNNSRTDGKEAVFGEGKTLKMQQLGDVYHHAGRLSEAAACYTRALQAGQPPPHLQQRCHLRLALCTVSAAERARKVRARGGGGGSQLSSTREQQQREEAECFARLLLDEEERCSEAVDRTVHEAHLTVGVFRLCDEWDVGGALRHFSTATANAHRERGPLQEEQGEEETENRRVPRRGDVGWGAVWLAQAIQGRAYEASAGFTAKAAAFGETWARTHLESWRRRLGRSCSGIGMGGVVEGAERLIVAGAWTATMHGDGTDDRDSDRQQSPQAEIADLHHTLSRTLLLLGASGEADGHARALEQLYTTKNKMLTPECNSGGEEVAGGGDGEEYKLQLDDATAADATALRLEIELLSRTPVVLDTVETSASLRRSLLLALKDLSRAETWFSGSIPSPLEVGLRAQFLATYQGLNDKAVATALTMVFDKASGGTLSYYSPHLRWEKGPGENPRLDGNHDTGTLKRDGASEQEPPWPRTVPSTAASTDNARSQPHEGSKKASASETCDTGKKRVRVGFLSAHFRWHSVGRLTVGLLERLGSSCSLEIFVIDASIDGRSSTPGQSSPTLHDISGEQGGGGDFTENPITKRLNAAGVSIVRLPAAAEEAMAEPRPNSSGASNNALENAQKAVAALKLGVLVYADVGMDALTTGLAHGRLSPVQVAFWGHPGTTGLSTMDYFITSDLFEGQPGADRNGTGANDRGSYGSFPSANPNGLGKNDFIESIPDEVGAEDRAEVADGGNTNPPGASETSVRQDSFSEQLVRLDGLGIVFDDPIRTFGWDPNCGNSNDLSAAATLSRNRSHDGREPVPGKRVAGEPRQHHSSSGSLELAPPSFHDCDGGASPEEGRKKDAATGRPRLYVCAQSLMKMHPAFDAVLVGILATDPLAQILLLRDSRQLLWHSRFRRRLRAAIDAAERKVIEPSAAAFDIISAAETVNATGGADGPSSPLSPQPGDFWSRVRFLSPLSGREFFRLQCRADVVLDPFPFGGGVTTLEALACGTPVVTAGALQSVHRLAEGMIMAAANAKRQGAKESHSQVSVDEAGGAPATKVSSAGVPGDTAPAGKEGQAAPEEAEGEAGSGDGHTTRRARGDGGQSPGDGGGTRRHCDADDNDHDDARVLVEVLAARTTAEYVEKAVAVAAPGAVKERVRRALCGGRDGMLRGDGDSVATDWERFLKNAAVSASSQMAETEPYIEAAIGNVRR